MSASEITGATVLVTGGTGSFGRRFAEIVLKRYAPKKLIVFSRDELKQQDMRQALPDTGDSPMRYFIGDVRDRDRLDRAFHGVDIVVHAAALKQVAACEYNPFEAIQTNVIGSRNGNVVGSRGSVIPVFLEQRKSGAITVTDPRMTRFWLTLDQGIEFVIQSIGRMHGGEIFVPKLPSMNIMELAKAVAADCKIRNIGIRAGEKLHEVLISEDEARNTVELDDAYVIRPAHPWWSVENWAGPALGDGFRYTSDTNTRWMTVEDMRGLAE